MNDNVVVQPNLTLLLHTSEPDGLLWLRLEITKEALNDVEWPEGNHASYYSVRG